jgi:anti-sigma factor RsiW
MKHDLHCKEILAQLSDYIDSELATCLCAEIEAHLDSCPDCQVMVDTLRKTVTLYRQCPPDELPADVRARLHKVLRLEERSAD